MDYGTERVIIKSNTARENHVVFTRMIGRKRETIFMSGGDEFVTVKLEISMQ